MDVLSHALLGFILGQALQLDTSLQLILVVSSVCLDIDALSIRSREAALRTHRGPLHSIPAALLTSLAIAAGYTLFLRLPATTLLSVIPVCLAGLASHLFLDLPTSGTLTALWPISKRNFALSLTHYIDPTFLGTLLIAAIFTICLKTDITAVQIIVAFTASFLSVNFGVRYYEKGEAIRMTKGLDLVVTPEIMSLPTIRPDRWWTIRKTTFENGYRYEMYYIDPIHHRIMDKDSVESPYASFNGPAEPPIDSPLKAAARSKKDRNISTSIGKFLLPAVKVIPSDDGETWQVFWYDAFVHMDKGECRGISAHVKVDGTTTVEARGLPKPSRNS